MSDTTLNRFLASGTNAQRIAFTPSPPTPASGPSNGYIWYETDTGNFYGWTGAAWAIINSVSNLNIPIPGGNAAAGKRVAWAQTATGTSGASALTAVGQGVSGAGGGGLTRIIDANGFWLRHISAASTGTIASDTGGASGGDSFTAGSLLPRFIIRWRTGSDLTLQRILISMNEQVDLGAGATVNVDSPSATQRGFYIRYSTTAGDTGFVPMSRDTAGLTTGTQIGPNIVASTIYVCSIQVGGPSSVTFTVNGVSQTLTTNIPTTTALGWQIILSPTTNSARQYDTESTYIESN